MLKQLVSYQKLRNTGLKPMQDILGSIEGKFKSYFPSIELLLNPKHVLRIGRDRFEELFVEKREAFNKVIEYIINPYEIKVKSLISLIRQAMKKIHKCYNEENLLTDRLKEVLAKNQNLRKKDFDSMLNKVLELQCFREKEIIQILEDFCNEEEKVVVKLRGIFRGKSSSPLEDFNELKEKILNRPMDREKKVSLILKRFHNDHEELTSAFRKLLKKGDLVRIKDFKGMIRAFHIERKEEATGVDEILEEFERVKDEISRQWQKVMTTVAS